MGKLDRDKIQVQKDGSVVYMSDDGFTHKPIQEAVKEKVQTENISNLINKHFTSLDLLLIDAEGYDGFILNDLFENSNFRPVIISEYVHINHNVFKKLIDLLDNNDYFYFQLKIFVK